MVGEQLQRLGVAARGEELEGADPDVARGDAREHGARHDVLADDGIAGDDGGERTRRGDAQRMHRLADDVFAQHRAQRGTAVAAARERCRARALELDVAAHARDVDDLAQQYGTAVAQLGHEVAELVAGIGQRDRLRTFGHAIAGQDLDALGRGQEIRVEAQLQRQRAVDPDQLRRGHRRRREPRIEAVGKAGVAVVGKDGRHAL